MTCRVFDSEHIPEVYVAPHTEQGVGVPDRPVGFSFTFCVCDEQVYVMPLYWSFCMLCFGTLSVVAGRSCFLLYSFYFGPANVECFCAKSA